jgi:hypothetical protein
VGDDYHFYDPEEEEDLYEFNMDYPSRLEIEEVDNFKEIITECFENGEKYLGGQILDNTVLVERDKDKPA